MEYVYSFQCSGCGSRANEELKARLLDRCTALIVCPECGSETRISLEDDTPEPPQKEDGKWRR